MNAHTHDGGRAPAGQPRDTFGAPTSRQTTLPRRKRSATWVVPAALLIFGAMPVSAGILRLVELVGGAALTPANARFFAAPLPVVLHIVGAAVYALLGAFQFATGFRRRRPGWHRVAGRLLVPAGLLVGLSGLWMTLFYAHPPGDGALLSAFRLVFGSALVASLLLGVVAIRRGDVRRHRAWMLRGYALGLG